MSQRPTRRASNNMDAIIEAVQITEESQQEQPKKRKKKTPTKQSKRQKKAKEVTETQEDENPETNNDNEQPVTIEDSDNETQTQTSSNISPTYEAEELSRMLELRFASESWDSIADKLNHEFHNTMKIRNGEAIRKRFDRYLSNFYDKYKSIILEMEDQVILVHEGKDVAVGILKVLYNDNWEFNGKVFGVEFAKIMISTVFDRHLEIPFAQPNCDTGLKLSSFTHKEVVWPAVNMYLNYDSLPPSIKKLFSKDDYLISYKLLLRVVGTSATNTSKYKLYQSPLQLEKDLINNDQGIKNKIEYQRKVVLSNLVNRTHASNLLNYASHSANFIELALKLKQTCDKLESFMECGLVFMNHIKEKYNLEYSPPEKPRIVKKRLYVIDKTEITRMRFGTWRDFLLLLDSGDVFQFIHNQRTVIVSTEDDFEHIPDEVETLRIVGM